MGLLLNDKYQYVVKHGSMLGQALQMVKKWRFTRKKYFKVTSPLALACQEVLIAEPKDRPQKLAVVIQLVAEDASIIKGLLPLRDDDGNLLDASWKDMGEAIANALLDGLAERQTKLVLKNMLRKVAGEDFTDIEQQPITRAEMYGLYLWICYHDCPNALTRLLKEFNFRIDFRYWFQDDSEHCFERLEQFYLKRYQLTCLHIAIMYEYPAIVELLIKHGADLDRPLVSSLKYRKTRYQQFHLEGTFLHMRLISNSVEPIQKLIALGTDVWAVAKIVDKQPSADLIEELSPLALLYRCHWNWHDREVCQQMYEMMTLLIVAGSPIPAPVRKNGQDYCPLLKNIFFKKVIPVQKSALAQRDKNKEAITDSLAALLTEFIRIRLSLTNNIVDLIVTFVLTAEDKEDNNRLVEWDNYANSVFQNHLGME